jgi:hypothetical protein
MATASFGGTNYTLQATPMVGTWPYSAQSHGSKVYCMSDECYATGVGTAGSHMYCGGLPAGAVPLISVVWPIDSDEVADGAAAMNAAVTGQLGLLATTGANARAADADLFGDVTALNAAATQVIEPVPDGSIYTTTLDFALREECTPVLLTADQSLADTEGIAVKILYTHGGRTY